ncbi:hypothetical protein GJ744_005979 [Endocarpon pusillum]|uniref:Uncharacterized protein n=1 Tax=Endocarpon pusillum TaxID=364733 RepID=A0A8H7A568_9EURO|nr:hypothetical protein GJ744_005979 [Endocarpon pusillum]
MSTASDPARIAADIHTQHVAGVSAQSLGERPFIGGEDVDVLVEAGGDEEGACFGWR